MEKVKPGYKRTEIGIIPNDWKIAIISEIGKVYSGGTPDTANPNYWDGDIFWCTPTDITALKNQKYLYDTGRKITGLGLKYSSSKLLPPNSVIVCTRATIGKAAINKIPMTTNQGFKNIIPENINPDLLYYIICNNTDRLIKLASGSTFLEVSKNGFDNFQIAVPILKKEQDVIASALSDVDSLIEKLTKLIDKKRSVKEGAMQQLLLPKVGWEKKTISDIADVKSGKRLPLGSSLIDDETPYPYIRVSDMYNGGVCLDEIKYVPKEVFPFIKKYRIFKNEIFISVAGTIGLIGMIPSILNGANLTENADKLTNIKCDVLFLKYLLQSEQYQRKLHSSTTFGAQPKLALIRIRELEICFHISISEQKQIASTLSDIDTEIEVLKQNLSKYKAIKEGMMQQLLTGQIRLI